MGVSLAIGIGPGRYHHYTVGVGIPDIVLLSGGSVHELVANGTVVATFGLAFGTPNFILDDNGASHALAISSSGTLTKSNALDFETRDTEQIVVRDVTTGLVETFTITVIDDTETVNFTNEAALLGALAI